MKDRDTVSCTYWDQNSTLLGYVLLFFNPAFLWANQEGNPVSKGYTGQHFKKVMNSVRAEILCHCYYDKKQ